MLLHTRDLSLGLVSHLIHHFTCLAGIQGMRPLDFDGLRKDFEMRSEAIDVSDLEYS
jgi:hypothetical protein